MGYTASRTAQLRWAIASMTMAVGLAAGCQAEPGRASMKTADAIRQELAIALPIGTQSSSVAAYLKREKIEHSELAPAGLSKHHKAGPGEQVINAAIRERAGTKAVSRVVTIDFRFGADLRLISIDARDQFTGP